MNYLFFLKNDLIISYLLIYLLIYLEIILKGNVINSKTFQKIKY